MIKIERLLASQILVEMPHRGRPRSLALIAGLVFLIYAGMAWLDFR